METTFEAKRDTNGRFLSKPEGVMQYSITKDNAREMARKRWEKYQQAAADAVTEEMGSIVPGVTTPQAAWGVLNARLATQIMDSNKPRGNDLDILGQNMGAKPNAYERTEVENSGAAASVAILSAAADVLSALRDVIRPADVIDGKVTDTRNGEETK